MYLPEDGLALAKHVEVDKYNPFRTVHHTHTNTDPIKYAATPLNQLQRCILTDYFNTYNLSKLK
jgi:hypothetical protein